MIWQRVRVSVRCLYGDTIDHGQWALIGRTPGVGVCVEHAKDKYRMEPPQFVSTEPAGFDAKSARVGDE